MMNDPNRPWDQPAPTSPPPPPGARPWPAASGPATWGQPGGLPGYGTRISDLAADAPVRRAVNTTGWLLVAAGLFVVVSAFLPWIHMLGESMRGIGGGGYGARDGILTATGGIVVVGLSVPRALIKGPSGMHLAAGIVAIVIGALITLVGVVDIADVVDQPPMLEAEVAIGLWLTLVGGLAITVLGIVATVVRR